MKKLKGVINFKEDVVMMGWLQRKNYDSGQVDYSRLVAELIRQLGDGGNSRLQRLEDTLEVTLNRLST